ncbi:nuclear transport factor 2 family protein [Dactylosporangium sp. CA-092794]|uniref:nuclear transport factor 2 family protein n=1 Tax=Dactylosporangium sp. CA-092794 TaxID=3239929 RepID=UPI003D8B74A9
MRHTKGSAATLAVLLAGMGLTLLAPPTAAAAADPGAPVTVDALARDVSRAESVREIKDLQRTYAQLAQYGRFGDMAGLFSGTGTLQWGAETSTGPAAIETWLRTDAGAMDGVRPGSLNTSVIEMPLVNLSVDGLTAKARFDGLRFMGDGAGNTRIEGGIYENEYVFDGGRWKISLLHYYPYYAGPYVGGWRNVGGALPIIPYHFTPETAGIPIPPAEGAAPPTTATAAELAHRISRMNDEDEVRNLQDAYGYYVDQRMWTDVVDLFVPGSTVRIDGVGTYTGAAGVRQAMERMGPENLTQGILNDHPLFDTIVQVDPNGRDAIARGIEIGMIGDANTRAASWEFNTFRNHFVKDNGVWKLKELNITPLMVANYATGWGNGGTAAPAGVVPAFLDVAARSAQPVGPDGSSTDPADLQRRLLRSEAYDGTENVSAAYGYYLDDLRCDEMGTIHATAGHKNSPFAGWFQGPDRIARACHVVYGANPSTMRSSISFHWRPQPVIEASQDGRSTTLRARLLQPSTSTFSAGSFNGAMYHDQVVLENGTWKLWSLTIDEFYWQSPNWVGGWAAANPRSPTAPNPPPSSLITQYRPDVLLTDVGVREEGFQGGSGRFIAWPEIVPMWFEYRNPVSGRVPPKYWPDCVPCEFRPDWKLTSNGYQLPPSGPSLVTATSAPVAWGTPATVTVTVTAGPGEPVAGTVELREGTTPRGSAALNAGGTASIALPPGLSGGTHTLTVAYQGSDRLAPGQTGVTVTVNLPPAWNASTVYNSPDRVTYNGKVFVANWYNRNQKPGDPYGAWQELAMTEAGVTIWTASRIFDTGDRVTYNGHLYEAKWWTRNQAPGDQYGPWKLIG